MFRTIIVTATLGLWAFAAVVGAAVWTHRTWGNPVDKDFPWAAIIYGENGTLKLSVHRYEWVPRGKGETVRKEVELELEQGREYHFRYLVDGADWRSDRHADGHVPGSDGLLNAVVITDSPRTA